MGIELPSYGRHTSLAPSLSFMYLAYKPHYWYWEIIEVTRRLILAAALTIFLSGSILQIIVSMIMTLIYLKFYGVCSPYSTDGENVLSELGQWQIFITYLCAYIFRLGSFDDFPTVYQIISVFLIISNMTVIAVNLFYIVVEILEIKEENFVKTVDYIITFKKSMELKNPVHVYFLMKILENGSDHTIAAIQQLVLDTILLKRRSSKITRFIYYVPCSNRENFVHSTIAFNKKKGKNFNMKYVKLPVKFMNVFVFVRGVFSGLSLRGHYFKSQFCDIRDIENYIDMTNNKRLENLRLMYQHQRSRDVFVDPGDDEDKSNYSDFSDDEFIDSNNLNHERRNRRRVFRDKEEENKLDPFYIDKSKIIFSKHIDDDSSNSNRNSDDNEDNGSYPPPPLLLLPPPRRCR